MINPYIFNDFVIPAIQIPRYNTGKDAKTIKMSYNDETGLVRKVLPDTVITGSRKSKSRLPRTSTIGLNYLKWDTTDLLRAMIAGSDIGDAIDVGANLYDRNYISAAIGAGLLALPNAAEKTLAPMKNLFKSSGELSTDVANARKFYIQLQDGARGFIDGGELGMPMQAMVPVNEAGLSVRNINSVPYDNYITNPAELAAAKDYLKELRASGEYKLFVENNGADLINLKVMPGTSEDWAYPYEVMVEHGLRKPVISTNKYTRQVSELVTNTPALKQAKPPKKTALQRSREYYAEMVEDANQGIYKRLRKEFNAQKALATGDMRHLNAGRPKLSELRSASAYIDRYSPEARREYNKIATKAAKRFEKRGLSYNSDDLVKDSELKIFLQDLISREGHRW